MAVGEVPSWAQRRRVLALLATGGAPRVEDVAAVAILRERGLLTDDEPVALTSLGVLVLEEDDDEDEPRPGVRVPEQRSGSPLRSSEPAGR